MEDHSATTKSLTSSWQNRFLVLLVIALPIAAPWLVIWLPTVASWLGGGGLVLWGMILLLPWAILTRSWYTVNLILVYLASSIVSPFLGASTSIVVIKASRLAPFFYFALLLSPLRRGLGWMRPGKFKPMTALVGIVVAALAAVGLIGWAHFARPDMGSYTRTLPHVQSWLLVLYMGGFAVINALIEEIIWRGVMLSALDKAFGPGVFSLLVQAASFGMAHYWGGFPTGGSGACLAGLFGLAMGWLRHRTNGLLTPWCVHTAADLTVILLIVNAAQRG